MSGQASNCTPLDWTVLVRTHQILDSAMVKHMLGFCHAPHVMLGFRVDFAASMDEEKGNRKLRQRCRAVAVVVADGRRRCPYTLAMVNVLRIHCRRNLQFS